MFLVNNCIYLNTVCVHWNQEKNSVHAIRRQCHKKNWGLLVPYMAPYLMKHYLRKYLIKIDVFYIIDDIILLMLKLASNKIDMYLTSLWRHERYLFSVFRGILTAIFRRFSKKLSTSVVVHPKNILSDY